MKNNIKIFTEKIKDIKHIVITTHLHPDADGIGSQSALCLSLRKMGREVICVNQKPLLDRYRYLDPQSTIISYKEYIESRKDRPNPDLVIVVDTNSLGRIGQDLKDLTLKVSNLLFIDHHPAPIALTAIHCIDTTKSATGELVGDLIEAMKIKFTPDLALSLYTAILIDTNSFRYPAVTGDTHRLIAKFIDTGLQPQLAYNKIYGTRDISHIKLLGKLLASAKTTDNRSVAWLSLSLDLMKKYNVNYEDTHTFINHLLILDGIKVACMFRETDDGTIKLSFRSSGLIDVGSIAQALGGGGHDHSAATVIKGELEIVTIKTIEKIQLMLSSSYKKQNLQ